MIAALVIGGGSFALANVPGIGMVVSTIFSKVATVVVPSAVVVAVKEAVQKAMN